MGFLSPLPWWTELILLGFSVVHGIVILLSPKRSKPTPEEDYYFDPALKEHLKFSRLTESASVTLSIIFPCYNEEKRVVRTLHETIQYLKNRVSREKNFTYEIIVVDDGSKDKTTEVALQYVRELGSHAIRVLKLSYNRGKGGAVIEGILRARGQYILFADGDGATNIEDVEKLERSIKLKEAEGDGCAVAVGSRAHLVSKDVVVKRSPIRTLAMKIFHFVVFVLGVRGIKDTQCGFKLFTRPAALKIFPSMHVEGWIFDIELLYLAKALNIPVVEVGVNWQEIAGSKVNLIRDSFIMMKDLFIIRYNYLTGRWKPLAKKVAK